MEKVAVELQGLDFGAINRLKRKKLANMAEMKSPYLFGRSYSELLAPASSYNTASRHLCVFYLGCVFFSRMAVSKRQI